MKRKIFIFITIFGLFINCILNVPVYASEMTNFNLASGYKDTMYNSNGKVLSTSHYGGWNLTWDNYLFYDTLLAISNENTSVYFSYDENGNRKEKVINNEIAYYKYDENNHLLEENKFGVVIDYLYEYDVTYNMERLSGFIYDNHKYWYMYDGDIIVGLKDDSGIICNYIYDDEKWIDTIAVCGNNYSSRKEDKEYIGNIQSFRYFGSYYDDETGWYYSYRYYDPAAKRYIDGISFDEAKKLVGNYPDYELYLKTYDHLGNHDSLSLISSNTQVVANVIFLESSYDYTDQRAVAWVIYNRTISNNFAGTTAFGVVSHYEIKEGNISYDFITYPTASAGLDSSIESKPKYVTAMSHAAAMENNTFTSSCSKPIGFGSQTSFRSVNSFFAYDPYCDNGVIMRLYNNTYIEHRDCYFVPFGIISTQSALNSIRSGSGYYQEKFNVFFDID